MTSFKDYMKNKVVESDNPFKVRILTGPSDEIKWTSGNDKLTLDFKYDWDVNPELVLEVKSGFMVDFKIRNSSWKQFASVVTAMNQGGVDTEEDARLTNWSTGIGGDDILGFRLVGGDRFVVTFNGDDSDIDSQYLDGFNLDGKGSAIMILKLRKDSEQADLGSYSVIEKLSDRDLKITMVEVIQYTESVIIPDDDITSSEPIDDEVTTESDITVTENKDPRDDESNLGTGVKPAAGGDEVSSTENNFLAFAFVVILISVFYFGGVE